MGTLIGSVNEYTILNELYVGETKFIKEFTELVSTARAPYVGKMKRPINGNKDFIKIGDMLAKEFGFHSVSFSVPFDKSTNAFTYPITMDIEETVVGKKPKFFDNIGLKYDESTARLCILVAVTSGVWFSKEFTDREVVAAILHEIGHSFVLQSERTIDIIESNRLSLAYSIYYKLMMDILTFNVFGVKQDIDVINNTTAKGKERTKKVEEMLAKHPLFAGVKSVGQWLSGTFMGLFKEVFSLMGGFLKVISIPFAALDKLLSGFNKPAIAIGRSQEYLSDSFATMYGFGPEISSFLVKIEYSDASSGTNVDKILNKMPIVGALHASLDIPLLLMSNSTATHPSTPARINKILDELEKELKNSDLDPKTKKAVKKNIEDLKKIKEECANPAKSKNFNAQYVRKRWIAFLTNKNETTDDLENYYTDLETRDKYVRKESVEDIELI